MTDANSLSLRQVCFILLAYNVVNKILLYPTNTAYTCGNDLLFPVIVCSVVQVCIIAIICGISSRTDKTLFDILKERVGETFTRIIFFVLALYFLFACVYPAFEQKVYVHDVFYETIPSLFVFMPFFLFSVYACTKRFNNVGRCADACIIIFAIIILTIMAMAFTECDFSLLLPVLKTDAAKLLGGTLNGVFKFSDSAFLLLFLGHFKYKKGDVIKLCASYSLGSVIVMLICALFYGIFGGLSPNTFFAVSKIAMFFSAINLVGRMDVIALYVLEIVMLFALVLNLQICVYCLEKSLNVKNRYALSFALNGVLLALTVFLDASFDGVQKFYMQWGWIVTVSFAYVLPLIIRCLVRRKA